MNAVVVPNASGAADTDDSGFTVSADQFKAELASALDEETSEGAATQVEPAAPSDENTSAAVPILTAPVTSGPAPTRETYEELQRAFDFFNRELFDTKLPVCLITLQREKRTFGYHAAEQFVRRTGEKCDEIAMNPKYFATRPIRDTLSTLVHEMAHLWQRTFGTPGRKRYHNQEWSDFMEQKLGLMPSHTGRPGGKKVGERMSHYILADGPFDQACSKLLTHEFTLSWMDRFPMEHPVIPAEPSAAEPGSPEEKIAIPSAEEIAEVKEAAKLVSLPEETPAAPRANRSNRVKYRCPRCETQVWGKPNIQVLCGLPACEAAAFVPVEPGAGAEFIYAPTPRPF